MPFHKKFFGGKDDISIGRRDFEKESTQIFDTFQKQQEQVGAGNIRADITATKAGLDAAGQIGGQIRGLQQELNPELFQLQQQREGLLGGQLAQGLNREALSRLGTGITEDERRTVQQGSRGAFTDRGFFRSNPAIFDEFNRTATADRQARMQNNQFASNRLNQQLQQTGQVQQGRAGLFIDPQNVLRSSGVGLTGGQLFQGISGLSGSVARGNIEADATEQEANRSEGFGRTLLKGAATKAFGSFTGF